MSAYPSNASITDFETDILKMYAFFKTMCGLERFLHETIT